MRRFLLSIILLIAPACASNAQSFSVSREDPEVDPSHPCAPVSYKSADYVVCRFDSRKADIRLFLNNDAGEPYGHFNWVNEALEKDGERLVFAMNAGMYHEDRSPVGLFIEDGVELTPLNTKEGYGNFYLKPNGVFFITMSGEHGMLNTKTFEAQNITEKLPLKYATQSGPQLITAFEINPIFLRDSDSRKRRNGIGFTDFYEINYVISDTPVTFYEFAEFFRENLNAHNALYLDGTISRLYAPELSRNDPGAPMGPIVGVVVKD